MKKKFSTKQALIASVLSLCLCFTMLIGTTYAWFTDSATSSGNIIHTGTLDVAMYWADGAGDVPDTDSAAWIDASAGAIFNNDRWEPGYAEAKHIKIANEGDLSLKYQMRILATGIVSELADVIDVYYFASAGKLDRTQFTEDNRLGTLAEVLNVMYEKNLSKTVTGVLLEDEYDVITLAFKMQETAGNEYQNLSIGADFSIQILATQYTGESDSFNNIYDDYADYAPESTPAAMVYSISKSKLKDAKIAGFDNSVKLDTGYSFQPSESSNQADSSKYKWSHADFYVYADHDVPAESMVLAGYYKLYDQLITKDGSWIGMTSPDLVKAGENNGVRLLRDGLDVSISYWEICEFGNDGTGFLCGAADLTGENRGTTITAELRVYEVECDDPGCHHNNFNCETGEYEVIGSFTYTFGGTYLTANDGAVLFMADNGEIVLSDTANVQEDVYYVPDGITAIGDGAFTNNETVREVYVSESVRSLGRAFDSNTTIEKVVLNEGLTEITPRAFKATMALEEVVIPDTVTTICDDAFQKTGLTTITIPESVVYVGSQAFGSSKVETVIFEGNPIIQNKAFRGCADLRTVYLNGDDVTFLNTTGQADCYFCNSESNNAGVSDITFYVKNADVAAKVYAAMGNEAGNTTVIINGAGSSSSSDVEYAKNDAALASAVSSGAKTVVLGAGSYTLPTSAIKANGSLEIVGDKNVVIDITSGSYVDGASVSFKGVTIKNSLATLPSGDYAALYADNVTYTDCILDGALFVGRDNTKFVNCTFNMTAADNSTGSADYVWTLGMDVSFDNCKFYTDGKGILIYAHGVSSAENVSNVIVTNCEFYSNAGATAYAISNQNCAAIEIDNSHGLNVNLITSGNTYDSNFSGEWRIKTYSSTSTITVNGASYEKTALDGNLMTVTDRVATFD